MFPLPLSPFRAAERLWSIIELSAGRVHAPGTPLLVRLVAVAIAFFVALRDTIVGERLVGGLFEELRS